MSRWAVGENEVVGDGVLVDGECFSRPHYERVGALAEKWKSLLGIDDFTARMLREGIRYKLARPEWDKGEIPVIPQTDEEAMYGLGKIEDGLSADLMN